MSLKTIVFAVLVVGGILALRANRTDSEIAPVGELLEGRDALVLERRAETRAAYDDRRVPADLRDLIPLAIVWGSSDNYSEYATAEEKFELKQSLRGRVDAIDRWLATFDASVPYPLEASTFFWMRDEYEVVDL